MAENAALGRGGFGSALVSAGATLARKIAARLGRRLEHGAPGRTRLGGRNGFFVVFAHASIISPNRSKAKVAMAGADPLQKSRQIIADRFRTLA